MDEHNKHYSFFKDIAGLAMKVHSRFHGGLLESAYEAALKYLCEQQGMKVERQVHLPIYWDDVQLDQSYRIDLMINGNVIVELKAIAHVDNPHRRQLWNYMRLTKQPFGMLINFGPDRLYSEWYELQASGEIVKVKMI